MIYVTGDTHGDIIRFIENNMEDSAWTKDDFLIICGDFGFVFLDSEQEEQKLDYLESKPYTICFCDGNHENFPKLYSYPQEKWNGGKVHKIRPSVIHLMRGQVFTLGGKKFFTFGGASSHDISGGILEPDDPEYKRKKKELDAGWKPYRINHVSWWKQELPTDEEMEEGRKNLAANQNAVDFIVTHCCAADTQFLLGGTLFQKDYLNEYFEEIRQNVQFTKWFFGHYHDNRNVNAQEILLYEQVIRIA